MTRHATKTTKTPVLLYRRHDAVLDNNNNRTARVGLRNSRGLYLIACTMCLTRHRGAIQSRLHVQYRNGPDHFFRVHPRRHGIILVVGVFP